MRDPRSEVIQELCLVLVWRGSRLKVFGTEYGPWISRSQRFRTRIQEGFKLETLILGWTESYEVGKPKPVLKRLFIARNRSF